MPLIGPEVGATTAPGRTGTTAPPCSGAGGYRRKKEDKGILTMTSAISTQGSHMHLDLLVSQQLQPTSNRHSNLKRWAGQTFRLFMNGRYARAQENIITLFFAKKNTCKLPDGYEQNFRSSLPSLAK